MRLTLTKHEARRLLYLRNVRDVDALVNAHVLIPAAYDPNGQPLFDIDGLRRAAATAFKTIDLSAANRLAGSDEGKE